MPIFPLGARSSGTTLAWERVLLGDADSSADPNSILVGSITETAGDAGTTSVTIDADNGSAYDNPDDALTYYFNTLSDYNGDALGWDDSFTMEYYWEVITWPGSSSEMIAYAGITSDTATRGKHCGVGVEQSAANPGAVRYYASTNQRSAAAAVDNAHGLIQSPKDSVYGLVASSAVDSSHESLATGTCGFSTVKPATPGSDPVTQFVTFGIYGTGAASDYTIVFRLWRRPIIKKAF